MAMDLVSDIATRARAWQDAQIIDSDQADRIIEFEGSASEIVGTVKAPTPHRLARDTMQALFGVFGVLLVGLGVLLTVITNWDSIDDLVKLALLVATIIIANVGGLIADARSAPGWVGTVAFAVGILVFGVGIFVVGTMYNVETHKPLGFLLIAVFGTGTALLTNRRTVGWLAAIGWLGWGMHEVVVSLNDLRDERMAIQLLSSALMGAIAAVALGWFLSGVARRTGEHDNPQGSRLLMQRADLLALPLRTFATVGMLVLLTLSSFAWHMNDLRKYSLHRPEVWVVFALAAISVGFLYRNAPLDHRRILAAALSVLATGVLALAWWPNDTLVAVAASIAIAAAGIGMVLLGLVESRRELFGWGIVWLAALIVSRYIDFMVSVDLGGPGFIGAGMLLLVTAVLVGRSRNLWRNREAVMQ